MSQAEIFEFIRDNIKMDASKDWTNYGSYLTTIVLTLTNPENVNEVVELGRVKIQEAGS
jgi:hypothetical protein